MKRNNISVIIALGVAGLMMSSCEGEKDLIIIDEDLPLKTSVMYMVGDATPTGWSIDTPTEMTESEEDPLIFEWEGKLNTGELKLCTMTGSWDAPFIRPMENGMEITSEAITDQKFQMHAGDPDEKWRVTEAGVYHITINCRTWTLSTLYVGAPAVEPVEPIEAENVYIVGDATPNGWNIDAPTPLEKKSQYIFRYEGSLVPGELKGCTEVGSWDVKFIRPASGGVEIGKNGVADNIFVYTTGPDDKWVVTDKGEYIIEFNLENYTITVTCTKVEEEENKVIETSTLFMIGDATPNGWSMDNASEFTVSPDNKYIFSWEGQLVQGTFKLCTERDGTFSCPFIRPARADVEVSENGVAEPCFVYTKSPDVQWKVTKAGKYRLTIDLENQTIKAEYLD